MAVAKGVWGIDIGQSALKALRLELVDGKPTATAFDYVEHAKLLSQPDADMDMLIREALDKFLSRNSVKNDDVAIGIAGQSGLARFVKLPPVEEKKIAEIVKFEAKQQIPFPLEEVEWDFQKIGGGESIDGFALETEIGLFAMKKDVISRYMGYFNSSKIEVHLIQMSPLALVNFATYELLNPDPPAAAPAVDEPDRAFLLVRDRAAGHALVIGNDFEPSDEDVAALQKRGQLTDITETTKVASSGPLPREQKQLGAVVKQLAAAHPAVNLKTSELAMFTIKGKKAAAQAAPVDETPRGKKRCTVVMDVGTDASNLIITDGAKIIWQRPIPLGGNNFTRALTKELKLTFAKAEHLKRNAAKSPDMASILKAIKPVLTDFVGEVQRSLGYFTNTHRDAHVAHLVGLGSAFKLPGLQKYLADKLSLDVKKPARFEKMGGEAVLNDPLFQENLLTFPIAYGLALQGLGQARLTTNLLPQGIRMDRVIRAKKPYAAAAAAALLVGLGGMAMGFSAPYAAITDKNIDTGIEMTKAAGTAFSGQESQYSDKLQKSKQKQDETKLIIAGQEERLNWPRLTEVFTASLPRPGETGNLNETRAKPNSDVDEFDQVKLWKGEGKAGQEAYDWFLRRMSEGVPVERAVEDANSEKPKSLAYLNIETVHTRWVNNAGSFLTAADEHVQGKFNVSIANWMPEGEREKDAAKGDRWKPKTTFEGGAWVIEIRGYTDHKNGRRFIEQSLLRNLQRSDAFAKDETKVGRYIVGVQDPVKGKISHAFVYSVWPDFNPQPGVFQHIGTKKSYLDGLLDGGTGARTPGGEPGPATPQPPGPGGQDLGTGPTPTAQLAPRWEGLGSTGGTATPTPTGKKPEDSTKTRFEFVVMVVWREPTPSSPPPAAPPGQ